LWFSFFCTKLSSPLLCVVTFIYRQRGLVPKTYWSLNFFIFCRFRFFFIFSVSFETSNINVGSTRKISDCKINALKVERVQNTFENLNFSEMTLKMLKMMQIYQKYSFWGFHCFFFLFLVFFKKFIKNMGKTLGSNRVNLG
jgi:hypothetical protein